jgi:hypothetical protein
MSLTFFVASHLTSFHLFLSIKMSSVSSCARNVGIFRNASIASCFPSLAIYRREWSISRLGRFAPTEKLRVPIKMRLVVPQCLPERFEKQKTFLSLPGIEFRFLGCLTHGRPSYPGSYMFNVGTISLFSTGLKIH